jgi:hypothetical protein
MTRLLFVAFALFALPVSAQERLMFEVDLATLNVGRIQAIQPIELDGRPGSEFLVLTAGSSPFVPHWHVIYPGRCNAGTVVITPYRGDTITDVNGDGIQEIAKFDVENQTVTFIAFPTCPIPPNDR